MGELFTLIIYQPFLNITVLFYWLHGLVTGGQANMGVAVIALTILIRILLLPLALMGERSAKERRSLMLASHELETRFAHDPITLRKETKKLFRRNRGVVFGEMFSLVVQVIVSLMLWRMFETGLTGQDIHLIYPLMPQVEQPFNMLFLGSIDLTQTSLILNLLQSFLIFLVETLAILTSPYPPMKGEVVRMQLVLPVISFLVFLRFPAGKKLFVITALTIAFFTILYKYGHQRFQDHVARQLEKERLAEAGDEQVVVETK